VDPPRAVAEAALRWLAAGGDGDARIIHGGYVIDRVTVSLTRSKRRALVLGTASVADIYDGPPEVLPFAAFDLGDGERVAFAGERTESSTSSSDAEAEARAAFVERRIPELLESLTRRYPARRLHGNDAAEAEPGP
jgi:hypothetical protein